MINNTISNKDLTVKKTFLLFLLLSLALGSCDDGKKKEDDTTPILIQLLELYQSQIAQQCPANISLVSASLNGQVGTVINSSRIYYTAPGLTNDSTITANKNCKFSNFTATSALPAGLTFSARSDSFSGSIVGTPTAQGAFTVNYAVTITPNNSTPYTITGSTTVNIFAAGSLTCSNVGAGGGCGNPSLPFSCTNSTFCYNTLSSCKAASECGY
ncbi:putative Ig domain-containing protein [Leptospira stimsonii]|uniref:putative Ig domain-containing protein n=1 Tax=Leptospira stimsonii TaxID=2202203 RepID=UPI001FEDF782|nr:putative Ig domain-containing protein [Leptospira stimsonii]